jgi:hypothetical protein
MNWFHELSWIVSGDSEENHELMKAELRAKIWTQDFPNMKQEFRPLATTFRIDKLTWG